MSTSNRNRRRVSRISKRLGKTFLNLFDARSKVSKEFFDYIMSKNPPLPTNGGTYIQECIIYSDKSWNGHQ